SSSSSTSDVKVSGGERLGQFQIRASDVIDGLRSFAAGDTVGLLIDTVKGEMTVYCNGEKQYHFSKLPRHRSLYLWTCVDRPNDELILSCRPAPPLSGDM